MSKQTEATVAQQRRYVTIKKAAEALGVPDSWLYERTRKNAVPLIRLGKYVRFDLDELLEWAKQGGAA